MIYFSSAHRIDEDYNLKITDNALARDLFPGDYHCLGDNENRPVKWMAIESLIHKRFSTASDVVSIQSDLCRGVCVVWVCTEVSVFLTSGMDR